MTDQSSIGFTRLIAAEGGGECSPLRAWLAVASVAAGAFLLVTTEFLPVGLLTSMAASMGVSDGQAGLVVTVPGVIAAIAAPALTIGAGSLDRRLVLGALTALIILSNVIAALAPNMAILLAGRVLLGIGVGGLWAFAVAVARRLVPEASGGRATAIISGGIGIGTIVGVPAGAMIGAWAGWRVAFWATAAFGVAVLAAQMLLLPCLPARLAVAPKQLVAILQVRIVRVGLVASMLVASGHFAAYTYLEPFLRQVPRLDQEALGAALAVYAAAGIVGAFVGEAAVTRSLRGAFLGVALLLGSSILLAGIIGGTALGAFAMIGLWGLAFGAIPVCIQIWMYRAAPDLYEGASALVVTAFQIALAAGALVGGLIVDAAGTAGAFVAGGAVAVAAAAFIAAFGRERGTASDA